MLQNSTHQINKKHYWQKVAFDSIFVLGIFFLIYSTSSYFSFSDHYFVWAKAYEETLDIDELPVALLASMVALLWFSHRRIKESSMLMTQNHALLKRVLEVQEEERKRIAQDLHDELGQYLIAIKAQASSFMEEKSVSAETMSTATRIVNTADHAYIAARHMMHSLRPVALDALGLSAALEHLVNTWQETQKSNEHAFKSTKYKIAIENNIDTFSEQINIAIFRIVQEALTNIAKHANAQHASVQIHSHQHQLFITIIDDGVGFDLRQNHSGYGLLGILERSEALGGNLSIKSEVAMGTKILVSMPNSHAA